MSIIYSDIFLHTCVPKNFCIWTALYHNSSCRYWQPDEEDGNIFENVRKS